jgi:hypothetical protein
MLNIEKTLRGMKPMGEGTSRPTKAHDKTNLIFRPKIGYEALDGCNPLQILAITRHNPANNQQI